MLSSEFPTSTGPPPIAAGSSLVSRLGTAGAGAERLGHVNRGVGRTGISLGDDALGVGLDCGFGLGFGFATDFCLFSTGAFGITAGPAELAGADVVADESTCPGCVAWTSGGASVLGVIVG